MILNLKKIREEKNFSQQEIAEYLGITRQTYSNIEKWTSEVSLWEAVKLASIFGISIEQFIGQDIQISWSQDTDRDKYKKIIKACIQYWSWTDGRITKTKLAKLCYLVDFAWFYNHLTSLTGLAYRKIAQWPVPDAYFTMIEELETEESIVIEKKGNAYMIENLSDIDDSDFDIEEIHLIKKICKKRKKADTAEIVNFTHKQLPWMLCKDREIIPYEFITQEEPDNVY